MALFDYKARSNRGDAMEGTMEAASSDVVATHLMANGMTPVVITAALEPGRNDIKWESIFPEKVTDDDLIQFSRQMHSLLKAGVPILSALAGLARSTTNKTFKTVIHDVSTALESGRDLATGLSDHRKVFSLFYISMIRIGETSGTLDQIFLQLTLYLERDKNTRKQIKKAIRYPIFVMGIISVALMVINLFVIPVFAKMFAKYDGHLPVPTQILVAVSNFTVAYWHFILVAVAGAVFGIHRYVNTEKGRYNWDKKKLKLPIIGKLIYRATLARFARLFSMSTGAGVPLITALTVVSRALDNTFVESRVMDMQNGIERGESISRTAAASGMFDNLVMQMMSVGEETGSMDELLKEVADYYDIEVEYDIEKLSSSIEPILTIFIGIVVLILALGVFLPMWNLAGVALHK